MLLTPSQASLSLICFWSNISTHLLRKSGFNFSALFCHKFSDVPVSMLPDEHEQKDCQYSLKQVLLHNSFHGFPPQSTWVVECGGSCSDIALVLAVKWSICRYVCLHHRHPLTHSLLRSPDEQKRLIYSGFKDTAFSPIWLRFPGGVVSFPLNLNQTGFDGIFVSYMSQLYSAVENMHTLWYQPWYKMGKSSNLAPFKPSQKKLIYLHSSAGWCRVKCIKGWVRYECV